MELGGARRGVCRAVVIILVIFIEFIALSTPKQIILELEQMVIIRAINLYSTKSHLQPPTTIPYNIYKVNSKLYK